MTYMCEGGLSHVVGKFLTRAMILLWTSPQLDVCTKSYGCPKWQGLNLKELQDSQLGKLYYFSNPDPHLDLAFMACHKDYYKGKVMVSSKSKT